MIPKQHKKVVVYSLSAVMFMFAFTFALVPLYNVFCQVTGINGKVDLSDPSKNAHYNYVIRPEDQDRWITVEFDVTPNEYMPWLFKQKHTTLRVRPGEVGKTAYFVTNPTDKYMVAQAIPSISPGNAAKHLKKVVCFCFNNTPLGPSETKQLDLHFVIDPKIPKEIKRLTLSYTLFDITDLQPIEGGSHD